MKRLNGLCRICGYPAENGYILVHVPLSSPPKERVVCLDCAETIAEALEEREEDNAEEEGGEQ